MTDDDFKAKIGEFDARYAENEEDIKLLEEWGDLLYSRATQLAETDSGMSAQLVNEADDKYQEALALNDTSIPLYEKLSSLYYKLAADTTPDDKLRLELEASIFDLGLGSALILAGDTATARDRFFRAFETTKETNKISIIPFIFDVGIDYMNDPTNKKYYNAAKKLLPTAILSGHEEVGMICEAIVYRRLKKALKPTLTARAAHELSRLMLIAAGNLKP